MSSHVDALKDASPNSPLIGKAPESIFTILKIVVEHASARKNRCATVEGIDLFSHLRLHSHIAQAGESVLGPLDRGQPDPKSKSIGLFFEREPSEVNLRQDKDTLVRFGLKKKEPNQTLEPTAPSGRGFILNVGQRKMKPLLSKLRSSELW